MNNLLDPLAQANLRFRFYRYRFLAVYIVIGVTSLWVEIFVLRALNYLGLRFLWVRALTGATRGASDLPETIINPAHVF